MNLIFWDKLLLNAPIGTYFLCDYKDKSGEFQLIKVDDHLYAWSANFENFTTSKINTDPQWDVEIYLIDVIGKQVDFDKDINDLLS